MPGRLVTVATFDYLSQAEVYRLILEQNDIPCVLTDSNLISRINIFYSNAIGGIKVQVDEADVDAAVELLQAAEANRYRSAHRDELAASAEPLSFSCESCGQDLTFSAVDAGSVQTCPRCGEYIDVPEPEA